MCIRDSFAIRTIQERTGKDLVATFLSGTTISNSLTELYLLFKYLRPKELEPVSYTHLDVYKRQRQPSPARLGEMNTTAWI